MRQIIQKTHTEGASPRRPGKITITRSKYCESENVSYIKRHWVKAEKESKPVPRFDKKSQDTVLPVVKGAKVKLVRIKDETRRSPK